MPPFVPGLELARTFYEEAIAPLLGDSRHSAALLGTGSDVLGFDTERSTDHGWGLRLQVFVGRAKIAAVRDTLDEVSRPSFADGRRVRAPTAAPMLSLSARRPTGSAGSLASIL